MVEDESQMQMLKIEINSTHATTTILKAYPSTLTSLICDSLANKLDIHQEQIKYFHLVLIASWVLDYKPNEKHRYIRTLKENENVLQVMQDILIKQRKKINYLLKIYDPNTIRSSDYCPDINIKWYYKDVRTTPFDCLPETSYTSTTNPTVPTDSIISANSSSSEDENEISIQDLQYLSQFERCGNLYRRSRKDPNLWHKRFCILLDRLWCLNSKIENPIIGSNLALNIPITRKKHKIKAMCIKLDREAIIYDRVRGYNYQNCIALQLQSNIKKSNILFFYTNTMQEQQLWIQEIYKQSLANEQNQTIIMSEMIINDEIISQNIKLQANLVPIVTNIVKLLPNNKINHKNSHNFNDFESQNEEFETFEQLNSSIYNFNENLMIKNEKNIPLNESNELIINELLNYSLNNTLNLDYSINYKQNYPILQQFNELNNETNVLIIQYYNFLIDINYYYQIYKLNYLNNRLLWIIVMIIYQKYIAIQISLIMSISKLPQEIEEIDESIDNKKQKLSQKTGFFRRLSRGYSITNNNKLPLIDNNNVNNSLKNNIKKELNWNINSNILFNIQKNIFRNIRRQIAGFDVPIYQSRSSDTLSAHNSSTQLHQEEKLDLNEENDTNDTLNFDEMNLYERNSLIPTNSMKQRESLTPNTNTNSTKERNSMSQKESMSQRESTINSTTNTNSSTITNANTSSWFGWTTSSTAKSTVNNETNSSETTNYNDIKENHYISYDEITNGIFPTNMKHNSNTTSTSMTTSTTNSLKTDIKIDNKPIYQIIDLTKAPNLNIFDDLVNEVKKRINELCNNNLDESNEMSENENENREEHNNNNNNNNSNRNETDMEYQKTFKIKLRQKTENELLNEKESNEDFFSG